MNGKLWVASEYLGNNQDHLVRYNSHNSTYYGHNLKHYLDNPEYDGHYIELNPP
jgi:hypothetical protein